MNITPSRHELEFGEMLHWTVPGGTAQYFVWRKAALDDASPRWVQVRGFNVLNASRIDIAGESTTLTLDRTGITAAWQTLIGLFDGHDPEIAMVTAQGPNGRPMSIDRFALPSPNSTDASTIAAQERKLLQELLTARSAVAQTRGHAKVATPDGTQLERMELAALDRRVAEVRARIRWFELASQGNTMPRAEHW